MIYLFKRFFAYYIDGIIISFLAILGYVLKMIISDIPLAEIENPSFMELFMFQLFFTFFYFLFFEFFMKKTIGKKILNLEITGFHESLGFNRLRQVLIRTMIRLFPIDPFSIFLNEERRMWHDLASKSKVIDSRQKK